ncbi:N-acetylmuramoyl-L-alanine amidase, partial [uncultured Oscillibacter sp.]|uniref:N-acetylmuramoyl-L-alanine amidase family protein n=1 Tax=uncultured Oscillibacter sp. TaxID=876091 RepID=UPI0026000FC5
KRIGAHLRRCGVTVVETRPDGAAVSLAERCAIANKIKGLDLFVSLHSNAAGGSGWSSARGWSAYLYGAGGEREQAANTIAAWVRQVGVTLRSAPIVYDPSLYVLKHTVAPAVLIEHAFHTNKEDVANLLDDAWRATVAEAEARGIMYYLGAVWVPETPQEPAVDEELVQAVDALAAAGVIDSPDRWKALEYTDRSVRALLIKMAAKLKC